MTGPGVGTDASTGQTTGLPAISGGGRAVYAVAADGSGGFYVGGDFARVGSFIRRNLAHVLADQSVDPAFHPQPNGLVGRPRSTARRCTWAAASPGSAAGA